MTDPEQVPRRNFLSLAAYAMGAVALGASGWVLIDSMNPAADTWARDVTDVDVSSMQPGMRRVVSWQGNLIFIFRRTQEDIREVRAEDWHSLRDPQSDESRVLQGRAEWLVVMGACTLDGCALMGNKEGQPQGRWGGWLCPCCSYSYDKSGRVRNGPASKNLQVPDYEFVTDTVIRIERIPV